MNKKERHTAIRAAVNSRPVASQEELRQLLFSQGWDVTQSTLSRDLREMRLARIPGPGGVRYASPESIGASERTALADVLPQFFASSDGVGELLVIKTIPGGAQPIAEAVDGESFSEVLGTIGGENTILVICRSSTAREKLQARIQRLAGPASGAVRSG